MPPAIGQQEINPAMPRSLQPRAKLALKSIFNRASENVCGNRVTHELLLLNRELLNNHNS
jgi:hypothetical protein